MRAFLSTLMLSAFVVLSAFSWSATAVAAPQMLGVVATLEPMPMDCKDGICKASLSSVCLQEDRPSPKNGTTYTPVDMAAFEVVLTDGDGTEHTITAAQAGLEIASARSYFAINAQLSPDLLQAFGAVRAAIRVREDATLIPEAVAGDASPITDYEIAHVSEGLRPLAERWIGNQTAKTQAAQTLNRWLNEIASAPDQTAAMTNVQSLAKTGGTGVFTGNAGNYVREVVAFCRDHRGAGDVQSFNRCLERAHDHMMYDINTDYWEGIKPGS